MDAGLCPRCLPPLPGGGPEQLSSLPPLPGGGPQPSNQPMAPTASVEPHPDPSNYPQQPAASQPPIPPEMTPSPPIPPPAINPPAITPSPPMAPPTINPPAPAPMMPPAVKATQEQPNNQASPIVMPPIPAAAGQPTFKIYVIIGAIISLLLLVMVIIAIFGGGDNSNNQSPAPRDDQATPAATIPAEDDNSPADPAPTTTDTEADALKQLISAARGFIDDQNQYLIDTAYIVEIAAKDEITETEIEQTCLVLIEMSDALKNISQYIQEITDARQNVATTGTAAANIDATTIQALETDMQQMVALIADRGVLIRISLTESSGQADVCPGLDMPDASNQPALTDDPQTPE